MAFRSENFQKDILSGKRFQCIKVCSLVDDLFFHILFRKRLGLRRYIYLEFFQETVELQLCVQSYQLIIVRFFEEKIAEFFIYRHIGVYGGEPFAHDRKLGVFLNLGP